MAGYTLKPWAISEAYVFITREGASIPTRQSPEAAGYDLCTPVDFSIAPGEMVVVPTGLVIQPTAGLHMEILPRSGLAHKHNIMFMNNVGLIDRDYAGPTDEIHLMLYRAPVTAVKKLDRNTGEWVENYQPSQEPIHFRRGERVGQLVFRSTEFLNFTVVKNAPGESDRGGLGSTGTK